MESQFIAYTYNAGYQKHYKSPKWALRIPAVFPIRKKEKENRLCLLTVGLSTANTASGGPGEVSDGNDEEAIAVISKTSEGVVPGGEGSHETEEATGHLNVLVRVAVGTALQVADTEQEEGQVQGEEQEEEGDGRLEGAEQHDGGEDEPALLNCQRDDFLHMSCGEELTSRKRPMES